jgi:TonB family protein
MKNFLFLTIAYFAIQMVSAQETTKVSNDIIYNTAGIDVKPEFPGGMMEFYKYIAKNYRTPSSKKLEGKVYVTFIIEKDGSVDDVKVLRDIGYGTGDEAIRVLINSPKWLPGEQNGQKVRCTFSLPIAISTR